MKTDEKRHLWQCDACGHVKFFEEEVTCWACGKGEMLHREVEAGTLVTWDEQPGIR